jgi:DNA-binding transcriptional LysR family regulator
MNLTDLRIFLAVARRRSLAAAAEQLHLTPSAISKAIRRLEESLDTELFDRSARQLALNAGGLRLAERAHTLLALAEQARADVQGRDAAPDCRIGGPAVLLWREGRRLAQALAGYEGAVLRLDPMFEEDALGALARGELSAAVVTGAVVEGQGGHWSAGWECAALGSMVLHLVAGHGHPLVAGRAPDAQGLYHAATAEVLAHAFACPTRSLFCGARRGARSDGWRDDELPRTIRYWTDDLQLQLALVRGGEALAYLPDFALDEPGLVRVQVDDCAFSCVEECWLVWDGRTAPDWMRETAAGMRGA